MNTLSRILPKSSVACIALALCLGLATTARAIERLPIEDFTRTPTTSAARVSPDGDMVAFLRDRYGRTLIHILDLKTDEIWSIDPGAAEQLNGARKEVSGFTWVGADRLLISTSVWDIGWGTLSMDTRARRIKPISGMEEVGNRINARISHATTVIHRFHDKDSNVLMLENQGAFIGNRNHPDILKVDMLNGLTSMEVKNPGNVIGWAIDPDGVARIGVTYENLVPRLIYRDGPKSQWRTLPPLDRKYGEVWPIAFDTATGKLFLSAVTANGRYAPFWYDPATGKVDEKPVMAHAEYDIMPPRSTGARIDGISLSGMLILEQKKKLVGVRYCTDSARIQWLDRDFAVYQASIDKSLPDTINLPVNISRDGKCILLLAFSAQDPGAYYLFDFERKKLTQVASRMAWIKPGQMAPMFPIKYTTRDGLVIHGYLTVPPGHDPKNMPLIVMPHGGPWARDIWAFDPLIQFFANRGYGVLQMNYRGSPGYGVKFSIKGIREIGGKIQDDIEDATRWAIEAGVADPKRIAIMGSSYGGYSALFALAHNPELYRCGISHAGVTDWPAIFNKNAGDSEYAYSQSHWRREIGDPETDGEKLKAISPVNFAGKIAAPLLVIQGKNDRTVPPKQAASLIAAMKKAGREPQTLFLSDTGHSFGDEKNRAKAFAAMAEFLEKHLGPGLH